MEPLGARSNDFYYSAVPSEAAVASPCVGDLVTPQL